jgi:hypothetical protein
MDIPAGSVEPGGQQPSEVRSCSLAEQGVKKCQELEGADEEGARAGGMIGTTNGHKQPAVRGINLDDLASPDAMPARARLPGQRGFDEVIGRVDVAVQLARVVGAEGPGPFPGPVELNGVPNFQDENGFTRLPGERLNLSAAQPLPADGAAIFLPDRIRGVIDKLRRG